MYLQVHIQRTCISIERSPEPVVLTGVVGTARTSSKNAVSRGILCVGANPGNFKFLGKALDGILHSKWYF